MKNDQRLLWLSVVGCLVLVNLVGIKTFARCDLTRDGVYKLAAASKETFSKVWFNLGVEIRPLLKWIVA